MDEDINRCLLCTADERDCRGLANCKQKPGVRTYHHYNREDMEDVINLPCSEMEKADALGIDYDRYWQWKKKYYKEVAATSGEEDT